MASLLERKSFGERFSANISEGSLGVFDLKLSRIKRVVIVISL